MTELENEIEKASVFGSRIVWFAGTLTVVVILLFLQLAINKDLLSLSLNAIGDAFAGFAGLLAFLWIIVTVALQSVELRLQRLEISGLRKSSEDQASSLNKAAQIQLLTFLGKKQADLTSGLLKDQSYLLEVMQDFLIRYRDFDESEFHSLRKRPQSMASHVAEYFIERSDDLKNVKSPYDLEVPHIKNDFEHEAFLELGLLTEKIHACWRKVRPIYELAQSETEIAHVSLWVEDIDLYWIGSVYPFLIKTEFLCREKCMIDGLIEMSEVSRILNTGGFPRNIHAAPDIPFRFNEPDPFYELNTGIKPS